METLRIEASDDSPVVILNQEENHFEISGKSLPEDVLDFYKPVLNWFKSYSQNPNPLTELNLKLLYFNTASSKLIMDILIILEEMVQDGHQARIKWHALDSDEDMQEAGREYEEMIDVPFEHLTYKK